RLGGHGLLAGGQVLPGRNPLRERVARRSAAGLPGDGDLDVPVGAADACGVVGVRVHAAGERGVHAVGQLRHTRHHDIHASLVLTADHVQLFDASPAHEHGEVEAVAADVHQRAAGQICIEADVAVETGGP